MQATYRLRLDTNEIQVALLDKWQGICCYVTNRMLGDREHTYLMQKTLGDYCSLHDKKLYTVTSLRSNLEEKYIGSGLYCSVNRNASLGYPWKTGDAKRARPSHNKNPKESKKATSIKRSAYEMQSSYLPELKKLKPEIAEVNAFVIQKQCDKVDKAFQNFFKGEAKYPNYKKPHEIGFEFEPKTVVVNLENSRIPLSGLGSIRFFNSREWWDGLKIRKTSVTYKGGNWFVNILVREQHTPTLNFDKKFLCDFTAKFLPLGVDVFSYTPTFKSRSKQLSFQNGIKILRTNYGNFMTIYPPRSGYTLPVFACAAALAALHWLRHRQPLDAVPVDLIDPPERVEIPIEQVAGIQQNMALAITRSQPGDNLDLTRNTPIWALVEWGKSKQSEQVHLLGGEGVGRQLSADGKAAIYTYADRLLQENLRRQLALGEKIQVTIILPEGRKLAERTSNAAFGVVEGLSLLGTTGISQPLSAPGQLEAFREELQQRASRFDCLVFCVGENGLDLARQLGINPEQLVKTANWLGPMLVEAGLQQVPAILLFGYHGKLIKLAGGIFHTHHHLADGRLEILTAHCAKLGLATPVLQEVFASPTAEAALKYLRDLDASNGSNWVDRVYGAIASTIDARSQDYIRKHSEQEVRVGSVLFDRDRQIIANSQTGAAILSQLC